MLCSQVAALVDRATSQGTSVEHRVHPDMVHNWHMLASVFRSGQDAIDEIGAFVRKVTAPERRRDNRPNRGCTSRPSNSAVNADSEYRNADIV
jgi:hypothetical protein